MNGKNRHSAWSFHIKIKSDNNRTRKQLLNTTWQIHKNYIGQYFSRRKNSLFQNLKWSRQKQTNIKIKHSWVRSRGIRTKINKKSPENIRANYFNLSINCQPVGLVQPSFQYIQNIDVNTHLICELTSYHWIYCLIYIFSDSGINKWTPRKTYFINYVNRIWNHLFFKKVTKVIQLLHQWRPCKDALWYFFEKNWNAINIFPWGYFSSLVYFNLYEKYFWTINLVILAYWHIFFDTIFADIKCSWRSNPLRRIVSSIVIVFILFFRCFY